MSSLAPTIVCVSDDRRKADLAGKTLNGIAYLEIVPGSTPPVLALHFLSDVSGAGLTKANFTIDGGERITGITVTIVGPHGADPAALDLTVSEEGDFSPYTLWLHQPAPVTDVPPGFDRQLQSVAFNFHLECPARFDCKRAEICPPAPAPPVAIDYLAKDYETFRQLMLDRMSLLTPNWTETNPADIGVMLVETIAYAADRLSYRQDATVTESYLGTARLRTSVKRHVRLVDYDMHDGCNARAWVHVEVQNDVTGTQLAPAIPALTPFATTLPSAAPSFNADLPTYQRIAATSAQIFESIGPTISLYQGHNVMPFYNWSATECCLPVGATEGTLLGSFPNLRPGDVLVLAEVIGPITGNAEDADPTRRQAVRLTSVSVTKDLVNGNPGIAVTDIAWDNDDALTFPLCIAHTIGSDESTTTYAGISAAIGNIVLVDHGRTLGTPIETMPQTLGTVAAGRRFRPQLPETYLTFAGPDPYNADGTLNVSAAKAMANDPTTALPVTLSVSATLTIPNALGGPPEIQHQAWYPVRSLFDAAIAGDPHALVVEVESDGTAFLRFGDGIDGAQPDTDWVFEADGYRVGQMSLGNVGAETITHALALIGPPNTVTRIWNPLAASGGVDPEEIENVRTNAPYAFRTQERAVTLADYARVAEKDSHVLRAAATSRLTRSWRTVLIYVELVDGATLDENLRAALRDLLELYRMAGVDVEFEDVTRIPLELAMHVCVDPTYRRDEVEQALLHVFSDQRLPDGSVGIFYPDRFTIGDPVYLGPFYPGAQQIPGVISVKITTFQRADQPGPKGLRDGYLTPGATEAFILRNNPDFPEWGTFTLTVDGGR
jgi:hypothetical protein